MKHKKITIEARKDFLQWAINKSLLYNGAIFNWWEEEGCNSFFQWGKKKGHDFIGEKS